MCAAVAVGSAAGCGGQDLEGARQPVPTFAPDAGRSAQAAPRTTILPTDCQDVMSGETMSALLGKAMDSVQSHTVLGVGSESVGRLERVSCLYQMAGQKGGPAAVQLNLAAYDTPAASEHQLTTNGSAELVDAQSHEEFTIGTARAMLFGERGQSVLLVSSGRTSITMTLRQGVVADDQTRSIMVDLAQRVLPRLSSVSAGSTR